MDHQKVEVEQEISQTQSQTNKYNWHCLQHMPLFQFIETFYNTCHLDITQMPFCSIHALEWIVQFH